MTALFTDTEARNNIIAAVESARSKDLWSAPGCTMIRALNSGQYTVSLDPEEVELDPITFTHREPECVRFYAPGPTGAPILVHEEAPTAEMVEWIKAQMARA